MASAVERGLGTQNRDGLSQRSSLPPPRPVNLLRGAGCFTAAGEDRLPLRVTVRTLEANLLILVAFEMDEPGLVSCRVGRLIRSRPVAATRRAETSRMIGSRGIGLADFVAMLKDPGHNADRGRLQGLDDDAAHIRLIRPAQDIADPALVARRCVAAACFWRVSVANCEPAAQRLIEKLEWTASFVHRTSDAVGAKRARIPRSRRPVRAAERTRLPHSLSVHGSCQDVSRIPP